MKKLFLFFNTAFIFISCSAVKFEAPQPKDSPALTEFPTKMLGTFTTDDLDTLRITQNSFRYSNGKEIDLAADLSAADAVLKKLKRTYFLNINNNDSWEVFPLKLSRNKIVISYADLDEKKEQILENVASVKRINKGDGKLDHYLMNPSDEEFKQLLRKKLFSAEVAFRRIK